MDIPEFAAVSYLCKMSSTTGFYTAKEEIANSLSHGAGILLGIGAGIVFLTISIEKNDPWAVASVLFYLFGMLSSYVTSSCYHACKHVGRKAFLRKCDHAAIYLHIAGTYVPVTWLILRDVGGWGWSLFCLNYFVACIGLIASFRHLKKHSYLETICFVGMGCSILIAFKPLIETLRQSGQMEILYWLVAGGVAYIVGAVFYSFTKVRYMHTLFHLFVLAGSVCHVMAIYSILV